MRQEALSVAWRFGEDGVGEVAKLYYNLRPNHNNVTHSDCGYSLRFPLYVVVFSLDSHA